MIFKYASPKLINSLVHKHLNDSAASFIIFALTNKDFRLMHQFSLCMQIFFGVQAVVLFSFVVKRIGSH